MLIAAHVQQAGHGVGLLVALHVQPVLGDVGLVFLVGVDGDLHRVTLVHPGDVQHLPGDGGGEHTQIAALGHFIQNVGHVPDEAHVQHPVGLVQHHGLDLVQTDGAALHVVHQAAGGGHHDLGALFQRVDLLVNGRAAVQAHRAHTLLELAQIAQLVLNLNGQLAGGSQHQSQNIGGFGVDVLHHGNAEGIGLAGAGGRLGNNVLPLQKIRDRATLYGGGLLIALLGQRLHNRLGQAELVIHHDLVYDLAVDFHFYRSFCKNCILVYHNYSRNARRPLSAHTF